MNEEGYAVWAEAETECQQALAAVQQARRTLRVARERQKMVKLNRQYFESSSSSRGPEPRREEKITCLRCGQTGHRAATCPAPQPKEGNRNAEMAPFVCFTVPVDCPQDLREVDDASPCVCFASVPDPELALQTGDTPSTQLSTPEAVNSAAPGPRAARSDHLESRS